MAIRKATEIFEVDQINFAPNAYISEQQISSIKKLLTRISVLNSKLSNIKKAQHTRSATTGEKGLNILRFDSQMQMLNQTVMSAIGLQKDETQLKVTQPIV